eukprot:1351588-Amorphochlora_amoeboformis.AAC.2
MGSDTTGHILQDKGEFNSAQKEECIWTRKIAFKDEETLLIGREMATFARSTTSDISGEKGSVGHLSHRPHRSISIARYREGLSARDSG